MLPNAELPPKDGDILNPETDPPRLAELFHNLLLTQVLALLNAFEALLVEVFKRLPGNQPEPY